MHINTDISAASNGAYQIRTRQASIPSFDNPNPRAVLAQQSQANRAAASKGGDTVQLSSSAAVSKQAESGSMKPAAKAAEKPAQNILEAIINPDAPAEKPAQSESNAAPPSFTVADLEAMLGLFGQSYDLNDADNADPLLVQYDLNNDGIIDADDLGTMLGMIQ